MFCCLEHVEDAMDRLIDDQEKLPELFSLDEVHSCEFCEKSFTSKQNLRFHIESVHENLKHNCCYCNSIFKLKLSLITHLKSKHTPSVRDNGFPNFPMQ